MASKREKIKLKSSKSNFYYFTTKNKSSTPDRITIKKYDPVIRQHVEFKEAK
ncbi:MAG: 50S ribosomal protein L33 [Chlamydiales bacterium]|nr:50S ribosomal protein L33 [Chlamydiales bacterium]